MALCFDCIAAISYDIRNLTSSRVNDMVQDDKGFIWIGTDNGLNRFDGWSNTTFSRDPNDSTSLKNNNVSDILSDATGQLWIATGSGIQKYEPATSKFSEVVFPEGIKPSIRSMIETGPDRLMVVSSGYGVFDIDTRNMRALKLEPLDDFIGTKYAHIIMQDGLDRIWIGGADGVIAEVDKNLRPLNTDRLPDRVADIEHDADNNIWAVTKSSLFRWDRMLSRFIRIQGIPDLHIMGLMRMHDGTVLLFTLEDGVYSINPKDNTLHELEEFKNIKKDGIIEMYQDKRGDIWCATIQSGLALQTGMQSYFQFEPLHTNPDRRIESLYAYNAAGGVTAALSDGVLTMFDSELNAIGNRKLSGRVIASYLDSDGSVLIGFNDGRLIRYDGKDEALIHRFDSDHIRALAKDSKGNYYVGLSGKGLYFSADMVQWKSINDGTEMSTPQKLGNNWINTILPLSSGKIWIGHSNGVDIFDPETETFDEASFLTRFHSHLVYALLEARDGSIWIGTNYGLYHCFPKSGKIEAFGKNEGMRGNIICGIAESKNGDIWTSTNSGISRIRHSDGKVINYHSSVEPKEREFSKGLLLKDLEGKIFIAGLNGLTAFHPDSINDNQLLAAPILTGVQLNATKDRNPYITHSPDGKNGISSTITLRHNQNTFSLDLSNFDYRNPESTEFEYRIPKLQKEWQRNPPGDNRVVCNYLDPGKYILEVRAVENGLTSPTTSILIHILPPWYMTTWALIAYIVIFALTVAAVWYELRRYRRQRQKEEMAEEKFNMLYDFAHELRSPATLIISPLPSLIREEKNERKANIFRMMQRNGYRITDLVNKMLDSRRIEKGQLKLSFTETDLKEYLSPIIEDFRLQAESHGISISFSAPEAPVTAYIDPEYFDKVIVNLISNALKFTPNGGAIDISLKKAKDNGGHEEALLEVSDTGSGIPPKDLPRIFERFYQGGSKSNGFGIGLNLSKMLVDMHHGTIKAFNREGSSGARFEVAIPLGRQHLKDKEISDKVERKEPQRFVEVTPSITVTDEQENKRRSLKHLVLIADDDEEIRNYLQSELGKYYKTVTASDGEEAYAIALEKNIDLIISDIMMPNADGFSLLKQIRSNPDLTQIPLILLTTSEDFNTRMSGWEKGADAYLTKPFHIEELRQLCSSLISGRIRLKGRYTHGEDVERFIEKVEAKGNDELLLERITRAVNENIGNSEFGVEELADAVGLSRVHLHRKMKALLGLAPRDFLKSVRLKRAAELLKKNSNTISQVGYMVGFSSPGQFSDSFRKYFSCSPSEYIARERGGNNIEGKEYNGNN